jgi:hypothetical protein
MAAKKKSTKAATRTAAENKAAIEKAEARARGLIRSAVHDALSQSIIKNERVLPLSTSDLYLLTHAVALDVLAGRQSRKNVTLDSDALKKAAKAAARAIRTADKRRGNRPDDAPADPEDFPAVLAPQTLEPSTEEDQDRAGRAILP